MNSETENIQTVIASLHGRYTPEQIEKINKRYMALLEVHNGGRITKVCKKYEIDRTSFYKWQKRFKESGIDGLADNPPVHHTHPQTTDRETIQKIVRLALHRPEYDCMLLASAINDLYKVKLSHVTVNKYLKKYSLHSSSLRNYYSSLVNSRPDGIDTPWDELVKILHTRPISLDPVYIKDISLRNNDIIRINITSDESELPLFHIRKWFVAGLDNDGNNIYKPTKMGVALPVNQIGEIVDAIRKIEVHLGKKDGKIT